MTINEMKQKIALCVATLQRLNGAVPGFKELCNALGEEYTVPLMEYMRESRAAVA
jgi:hypothetical protein